MRSQENVAGALVGRLITVDEDWNQTYQYSIDQSIGTDGSMFRIVYATFAPNRFYTEGSMFRILPLPPNGSIFCRLHSHVLFGGVVSPPRCVLPCTYRTIPYNGEDVVQTVNPQQFTFCHRYLQTQAAARIRSPTFRTHMFCLVGPGRSVTS